MEHLLCNVWHDVATSLEDCRASAVVTAIDYAKAFNRLDYKCCLESLAAKGASSQVIRLIATFLTNRTMQVRVGSEWSDPLPVSGGVPQGSLLGVILFNATTDDLESGRGVHDRDVFEPADEREIEGQGDVQDEHATAPAATSPSSPLRNQRNGDATPSLRLVPNLASTPSLPGESRTFGTPSLQGIHIRNNTGENIGFRFLPGARNIRRRLCTSDLESTVPHEPPTGATGWKWKPKGRDVALKEKQEGRGIWLLRTYSDVQWPGPPSGG